MVEGENTENWRQELWALTLTLPLPHCVALDKTVHLLGFRISAFTMIGCFPNVTCSTLYRHDFCYMINMSLSIFLYLNLLSEKSQADMLITH